MSTIDRQAAVNAALTRNMLGCGWVARAIAADLQALPTATCAGVSPTRTSDTLEQLREEIIAGCQRLQRIRIGVSARERQLAGAQESFWRSASAEELFRFNNALESYRGEEPCIED